MNNNFAENLKKVRKDNNLSQEQLAEELGVSRQAISKWESALAYPEMDKIIALCDKFNLNIDDLLHKDIKEVKGEEETKNNLNKYIDDFLKFITDTLNFFCSMNFKSKIKCLFEQTIIIIILIILSTLFYYYANHILIGIISFLPLKISHILKSIFDGIIFFILGLISLIVFVHIFKTRYLNYYENFKKTMDIPQNDIKEPTPKIDVKSENSKIIIRDPETSEYSFIKGLFKFIIIIIKIFAAFFLCGLCLSLICLFCGLILTFLIWKTGLFFIGLLSLIISLSSINIIVILIILNFIFNRKSSKKRMIWSFIISLIILGISLGLILIGSLNFNIVKTDNLKTKTIEYNMQDDLFFEAYKNIEYIAKDIDNIEIEYQIYNLCELKPEQISNHAIYLETKCSNYPLLIKDVINNLNHQKILDINYDYQNIKIYASPQNILKLQQNAQDYYHKLEEYNDEITNYENIINEYNNQINSYEDTINKLTFQLENCQER